MKNAATLSPLLAGLRQAPVLTGIRAPFLSRTVQYYYHGHPFSPVHMTTATDDPSQTRARGGSWGISSGSFNVPLGFHLEIIHVQTPSPDLSENICVACCAGEPLLLVRDLPTAHALMAWDSDAMGLTASRMCSHFAPVHTFRHGVSVYALAHLILILFRNWKCQ